MSAAHPTTPRQRIGETLGRLWWSPLIRGILLLILGGYALVRPGMTIGALAQVVGIFVVADGVLAICAGLFGESPSRMWVVIRGVLEILVGLFVFAHPILVAGLTATVLVYLLACAAVLGGILEAVAAIGDRKEIEGEGWLILGGALMVLFGVILLVAPLSFGLLLVRVLGVFAIASGVSLTVFAFRLRRLGSQFKG